MPCGPCQQRAKERDARRAEKMRLRQEQREAAQAAKQQKANGS